MTGKLFLNMEEADTKINSEQMGKHAQDLHELKPHMIPARRGELDMKAYP